MDLNLRELTIRPVSGIARKGGHRRLTCFHIMMEITVRMSVVCWRSKCKEPCLFRAECIQGYPSLLESHDCRLFF